MSLAIVAIVGRPNVGKSTLFNKLIGQRLSIVEDTPGVTRDRIYAKCEWLGHEFMLVDTGGIEPESDDIILAQMRRQAELAILKADVTILVTDLKCGVTATDYEVAQMLLKSGKPIVLCVNKVDNVGEPPMELYEFYNLGLGEPFPVSSVSRRHISFHSMPATFYLFCFLACHILIQLHIHQLQLTVNHDGIGQ